MQTQEIETKIKGKKTGIFFLFPILFLLFVSFSVFSLTSVIAYSVIGKRFGICSNEILGYSLFAFFTLLATVVFGVFTYQSRKEGDFSFFTKWAFPLSFLVICVAAMVSYLSLNRIISEYLLSSGLNLLVLCLLFIVYLSAFFVVLAFFKSRSDEMVLSRSETPRKAAKVVNSLFPYIFCLYLCSVWFPNIMDPSEALHIFLTTGVVGSIYQFKSLILFVYFLVVLIVNRKKLPIAPLVGFILLICYLAGVMFLIPRMDSFFFSDLKNNVITQIDVTVSLKDQFSYFGPGFVGIIYIFCLIFIAPIAANRRKTLNIIAIFIIFVAVFSMFFSYGYEFADYKERFLNFNSSKWAISIASFYRSKNVYGLILVPGCSALLFLAAQFKGWRRWLLVLGAIFITGNCLFIRCDDAFCACVGGLLVIGVYYWLKLFLNHKKIGISLLISLILVFILVVVLSFIPAVFENVSLFGKIHLFLSQFATFSSRTEIWFGYFDSLKGIQFLFGKGAIGEYSYLALRDGIVESFSLHNGFIECFNTGGIVLVAFFFWIMVYNARLILRKVKGNRWATCMLFAIMVIIFLYGFGESNTPYTARNINTAGSALLLLLGPYCFEQGKTETNVA